MNLKKKIKIDLDKSLKDRKKLTPSVLRLLLASILNKGKEKRAKIAKEQKEFNEKELIEKSELQNEEIIQVILSEIKKRKEAISEYKKGKREDLADKEKRELEILQEYLPEQMSEEEIRKLAKEIIAALRASLAPSEREKVGIKDMGGVMKEIMPKIKGRAEGTKVNQVVKELLIQKGAE